MTTTTDTLDVQTLGGLTLTATYLPSNVVQLHGPKASITTSDLVRFTQANGCSVATYQALALAHLTGGLVVDFSQPEFNLSADEIERIQAWLGVL